MLHIIFSTKERAPLIQEAIQKPLHAYLATICRNEGCHAYRVGGVEDHVHIVTTLTRTLTVAKLIEKVNGASSTWTKEQGPDYRKFYWQNGYGAFSVSPKHLQALLDYVEGQKEHHQKVSFQDEYRLFLKKNGVEFDERYMWD